MSSGPQLEDVPELMQNIQLRLPVKEAVRTCVLSKSWLHAWLTIPILRSRVKRKEDLLKLVDIVHRCVCDNIPIKRFDLDIDIKDREWASLAEEFILTMAIITCTLKEVSLSFRHLNGWFDFPYKILSCEKVSKIRIVSVRRNPYSPVYGRDEYLPVTISCAFLRELDLEHVNIRQEVLDDIFSSCRLLVKINLVGCLWGGLYTIKVKNLPCLSDLRIVTQNAGYAPLEINNVPNLRKFAWDVHVRRGHPCVPYEAHSISLASSVMELSLSGVVTDNRFLDMIKSGVPFLESLTLEMGSWQLKSFHFTCASIKRLSLLFCQRRLIDVKVFASNLLFFRLDGDTMPSLLFPISTLIQKTRFDLKLQLPVNASFFLNLREALALSSNCYVHISLDYGTLNQEPSPFDVDIDDLRTRLQFPPTLNVQKLSFETRWDKCQWDHSPFFDAFFEICHPNHVTAMQDREFAPKNHFCKVMLTEVVLEKEKTTTACWPRCLKRVQVKHHENWETLKNSRRHRRFLNGPTSDPVYFKLKWH